MPLGYRAARTRRGYSPHSGKKKKGVLWGMVVGREKITKKLWGELKTCVIDMKLTKF